MTINYVLPTGWAVWLRKPPRALAQPRPTRHTYKKVDDRWLPDKTVEETKADPTWVTRFALKFQKDKEAPTGLKTPMGSVPVLSEEDDPQKEVDFIVNTLCCEYHRQGGTEADHIGNIKDIATTLATMRANGIDGASLDGESPTDIGEESLRGTPVAVFTGYEDIQPSPAIQWLLDLFGIERPPVAKYEGQTYISHQQYRIDSEQMWLWSQSKMWRVRLAETPDGRIGFDYKGYEKKVDDILARKRHAKDVLSPLPTIEDHRETLAFVEYYGGRAVLALMDDAQLTEHRLSRIFANSEDPDPGRTAFHAANLRAVDAEGNDIDGMTTQHGHVGVYNPHERGANKDAGYAGPQGSLGLDEPTDDDVYRSDDGFFFAV